MVGWLWPVFMHVCVCMGVWHAFIPVCQPVCLSACVYACCCMPVCMIICLHVYIRVCDCSVCVYMYVCMHVCMYVFMRGVMTVGVYACLAFRMEAGMYASRCVNSRIYVCVCMHVCL